MKGLFYKDFVTIWSSYKKNALLVLAIYTGMGVAMDMPFMMYAMVFLLGLYTLTTLSFDEQSRWDAYGRTLPVTAGQIVGVKYLLGLLFMGGGTLLCMALLCAMGLYKGTLPGMLAEYLCGSMTSLSLVLFYYAVSFPLSYHFGAAKARSAVMLVMAGAAGLLFVAALYLPGFVQAVKRLDTLDHTQGALLILGLTAACLLLYLLSWAASTAIYRKKEY